MFNETTYNFRGGLGAVNLSTSQQTIAQRIIEIGQSRGMSAKQIQAALSAGWVESRYQNLNYGDRDSLGVFQQRPSQGWGSPGEVTNVDYAINAFYDAAARVNDSGMTFGQLAQAVQRSAYPSRYGAAGSIVDQILSWFGSSFTPAPPTPVGGDDSGAGVQAETSILPVDLFSGANPLMLLAGAAVLYFVLK